MSESVFPALSVQPYDPYTPLAKLAQIGQANAQTQGQQIQNQGNQLGLLLQRARLAPFLNGTTGAIGGGSALGALAAPGMGGAPPAPMPQAGGQSPPAQAAAPAQPAMPGDIGEQVYGVAMPPMTAMSLAGDKDPTGSLAKIAETRRQLLYSAAANADSPQAWDQAITSLAQEGWLSSSQARATLGRYDLQPRILQAMASPDANSKLTGELAGQGLQMGPSGAIQPNPGAIAGAGLKAQATAGGTAAGELPLAGALAQARAAGSAAGALPYAGPTAAATAAGADAGHLTSGPSLAYQTALAKAQAETPFGKPIEFDVPRPGGGSDHYVLPPGAYAPGGPMAAGAAPSVASGSVGPAALASIPNPNVRNMAVNAALRANLPPQAWAAWISAVHSESGWNLTQPDGAAGEIGPGQIKPETGKGMGYTPAQLRDPQTNLEASARYFGQQWAAAHGDPVGALRGYNGGSPGAVAAQPYAEAGMQRAQRWAGGAAPVSTTPPAPAPSVTGASPGAEAAAPGVTAAPAIPGAIVGTSQAPAALKQQETDIGAMAEYRKDLLAKSQAATQNNAVLDQMQNEAQNFTMGRWADVEGDARAMLDSLAKNLGVPESGAFTSQVGSQQAFMKNAGQLARTAAHELSARVGVQELSMIQKTLPSDEMSPQAFRMVANQLGGINDYLIAKSAASATATGNPNAFEASWNQNVSPAAFVVHRMSSEDLAALHAKLMQTPEGQQSWKNLRSQVGYAEQHGLFN